jgi:hypothetical protein
MTGAGIATGCCNSAVPSNAPDGALDAVSVCSYGSLSDASSCNTIPTNCSTIQPYMQSVSPPEIPDCSAWGNVVPPTIQGSGSLYTQGVNSARFPANVLLINPSSISVVQYGADPLNDVNPSSFSIGSVQTYCVSSAVSTQSGSTSFISLVLPALASSLSQNCVYTSVGGANNIPAFYLGTLAGTWCEPTGVIPWPASVTSWTPTPPTTPPTSSPLSITYIGMIAAAGGIVLLLGVAGGVWYARRRKLQRGTDLPLVVEWNPMAASDAPYVLDARSNQQIQ